MISLGSFVSLESYGIWSGVSVLLSGLDKFVVLVVDNRWRRRLERR